VKKNKSLMGNSQVAPSAPVQPACTTKSSPIADTVAVFDPIPLTAPDGKVLAFACPHCFRVSAMVRCADLAREIEATREYADKCCRCRDCGVVKGYSLGSRCDACEAAVWARINAEAPARRAEAERQAAIQAATYQQAMDPDIARALATRMSEISEEQYCAGWMSGLEFALWSMVLGGSRSYGLGEIETGDVEHLRRLSEKSGGWIRYEDGVGEVFVATEDWQRLYRSWESLRRGSEAPFTEAQRTP
jgi:hypothetical protein